MNQYVRAAGLLVSVAGGWIAVLPPPVGQPLTFNHAKHAAMACPVCHRGSQLSARAGIPQVDLCLKCHATAPAGPPSALWEDAGRGRRVDWVRVTRVPDHVLFSHRRHTTLGRLDCVSCHGAVGRSPTAPGKPPVRLDMDACLGCHRREGASQDCAACHR